MKTVAEIEVRAKSPLGDRFMVWPHSNFICLPEPADSVISRLSSVLNVSPRLFEHERLAGLVKPKLLRRASCIGLKPDVCVAYQIGYLSPVVMKVRGVNPDSLGIDNLPI